MKPFLTLFLGVTLCTAAEQAVPTPAEAPAPPPAQRISVSRVSDQGIDMVFGLTKYTASDDVLIGMSGVGLGGMIGLSALGKVEYKLTERQIVCLDGGIGLAGGEYGVAYLFYGESITYRPSRNVFIHNNANAVGVRLLQVNRQRDDKDLNDAWYGKDVPRQRYNGVEFVIMFAGARISPGIFKGMTDGENYGSVGYGLGF